MNQPITVRPRTVFDVIDNRTGEILETHDNQQKAWRAASDLAYMERMEAARAIREARRATIRTLLDQYAAELRRRANPNGGMCCEYC